MQDEFVQFAQKALIIKNDKLLIIQKSNKDPLNPFKWDLPGGRKQIGESVDEHIKREVREEVGLNIEPKQVFDLWSITLNKNNKLTNSPLTIVFNARICEYLGNESDVVLLDGEVTDFKWVNIGSELLSYDFLTGIRPIIERFVKTYK